MSCGTITKDVDQSQVDIAPDGTATFDYTVSVTHEIGPDSGWWVYGVIHVRNPNAFEVAGVQVSDAVDDGGSCTVEGDAVHTVTITHEQFRRPQLHLHVPVGARPVERDEHGDGDLAGRSARRARATRATATFDFAGVEPTIGNGSVDVYGPARPRRRAAGVGDGRRPEPDDVHVFGPLQR